MSKNVELYEHVGSVFDCGKHILSCMDKYNELFGQMR